MDTLEYSFDREVTAEGLHRLMLQTGWGKYRTVERLRDMLSAGIVTLGAWDGDKLVGFVKVMTDGAYRALIEDVIVDEPYRGKGVGTRMMQMVTKKYDNVEHTYLITGEDKFAYYGRFGFFPGPGTVMMRVGSRAEY